MGVVGLEWYSVPTLWVWLGKIFSWDEVHDGGLAKGQPEGAEGHVAVQEAALVDEAQDLRLGHRLLGPACNTKNTHHVHAHYKPYRQTTSRK